MERTTIRKTNMKKIELEFELEGTILVCINDEGYDTSLITYMYQTKPLQVMNIVVQYSITEIKEHHLIEIDSLNQKSGEINNLINCYELNKLGI